LANGPSTICVQGRDLIIFLNPCIPARKISNPGIDINGSVSGNKIEGINIDQINTLNPTINTKKYPKKYNFKLYFLGISFSLLLYNALLITKTNKINKNKANIA
jgi:hypothetical protein